MKKIIALFLFISFLAPLGGTFIWFKIEQKGVRKAIKKQLIAGVEDSELTLLRFSKEEIKTLLDWKHEKEFAFNGIMYDIVKQSFEKDTYYFWCWKDDKETLLYKKLENLVASALGNDRHQSQKQCQLRFFYQTLFFNPQVSWRASYISESISNKTHYSQENYSSSNTAPITPPPQFVL